MKTALGLVAMAVASASAQGVTFGFGGFSQTSPGNTDSGEQQLSVDLFDTSPIESIPLDAGSALVAVTTVDIVFRNNGSSQSSLTGIYFDDPGLLTVFSFFGNVLKNGPGVNFETPADPVQLPGGAAINFVTTFSVGAIVPKFENGVNPGEELVLTLGLLPGITFQDVIDRILSEELRFGLLMENFADGGNETFVNNPTIIPLPSAFLLGGSVLGLAATRRRRF